MPSDGYNAINKQREIVVAAMRDISALLGEKQKQPVNLHTGGASAAGLGMVHDAELVAVRARDIEQGIFKVIVMGEFKNGKSTLLNALLGEKVLPARVLKCTAIITCLVHGDSRDVIVYEVGKEPQKFALDEFWKKFQLTKTDEETLGKQGYIDRFKDVEYAQIESNHRFCANGVRLVDSPGLGDQMNRTRMTTNFWRQSHATVLVMNATQTLSGQEKHFINTNFVPGKMSNVFIVVNRINQIAKEEITDVEEAMQYFLEPFFPDKHGTFDHALYRRRVFFVNALGALEARSNVPVDLVKLEGSSIPAFERELELFLTSEDKVAATFDSTLQEVDAIVDRAHKKIAQDISALALPLVELERHRQVAEKGLQDLEQQKNEINKTLKRGADAVAQKIYSNLQEFVNTMEQTWLKDSVVYLQLKNVDLVRIFASFAIPSQREKLAEAVRQEVNNYMDVKFGQWAKELQTVVDDDAQMILQEVQHQVTEFQLKFDQILNSFSGIAGDVGIGEDKDRTRKWVELLLNISMLNMGGVGGAVMGKSDWGSFFGRIALHLTLLLLAATISGPIAPIAWILVILIELFQVGMQHDRFKRMLRQKVGEQLFVRLRAELPKLQQEINLHIQQQFGESTEILIETLQAQIDEARVAQEDVLQQKRNETFSAEQAKHRLDQINALLITLLDRIHRTVPLQTPREGRVA